MFKPQFVNRFANLYTKTDSISLQVYVTRHERYARAPLHSVACYPSQQSDVSRLCETTYNGYFALNKKINKNGKRSNRFVRPKRSLYAD